MTRYEILDVLTTNTSKNFIITHTLPNDEEIKAYYKLVSLEGEYIIAEIIVTGDKVPIRLEHIRNIMKLEA
ncbi:hypothetical protein SALINJAH_284 [Bacillus phage SalinJah]|uniref:Uncharacterized protein n=1 Tax=Bacillus phage SalinJah TaxID=1837830 RepID=A0A173GB87_9CAUD|nr:hypothetical protein SALINJAH_284 [Bacillus phage SalinJah]ANH50641.1 hypothetical protein SALINJAH_284 [Bacillus phage SalinJah]